jgi:hypothetical protein
MAFRDLSEFLTVETLDLPIRGKVYRFPGEISARSWLLVQRVGEQFQAAARAKAKGEDYSPEAEVLDDTSYAELSAELFGGVDAEMAADGLTSAHVKLAFATLLAYHLSGRDAAEAVWNAGGVPVPLAPTNRETRRAAGTKPMKSRDSRAG